MRRIIEKFKPKDLFWLSIGINAPFYLTILSGLMGGVIFGGLIIVRGSVVEISSYLIKYASPALLIPSILLLFVAPIKKWVIWSLAINLISITFFYSVAFISWPHGGFPHVDSRRLSDLRQMQNALELYYGEYGQYPHVSGETSYQRWEQLTKQLTNSGIGVTQIPNDPKTPQRSYDYKDGDDGRDYVLSAILEYGREGWLDDDVDGVVYSIDCGINSPQEKEYCVTK